MNMKTLAALALLASSGLAQYAVCDNDTKATEEQKVETATDEAKPDKAPQPSEETPAKPAE